MGFHRSVSPSPSKRSSISTDADENQENYNPVMRGHTTPRHKRSETKNYMASTFSAASKAVTPKKKAILSERNNPSDASSSSSDPEPEPEIKNPVLGGLRSPMPTSTKNDDKDEKPYDPQTNFLSPRPRFLRYNPERRREVFRDSVSSDSNSSDSASSSGLIAGEIGGLRLSDDEETKRDQEEANNEVKEIKESDKEAPKEEEEEEEEEETSEETAEEEEIRETSDESEEADEEEEYEHRGGIVVTVILMLILGLLTVFIASVNHSRSLYTPPLTFGEDVSNEFGRRRVLNNSMEDLLLKRIKARSDFLMKNTGFEKEMVDQGNQVEEKGFEELSQMKISEDSESVEVVEEQEIEEVPNHQIVQDSKLQEEEEDRQVLEASFVSPLSEPVKEEEEQQEVPLFEQVEEEEEVTNKSHGETKVGYLIENLKRIEAEFALKLFMGIVSFMSVIAYLSSQVSKKKPTEKKIIGKKEEELNHHHHNQVYSYTDNLSYTQSHAPSVEFMSEFEVSSQNKSSEDSPLYRSFSAREQFGEGEAQTMVTPASKRSSRKNSVMTPVRRSDRIRSRTIKSP